MIDNKFEMLKDSIKDKVDIWVISETKLDQSFSNCMFSHTIMKRQG